MTRTVEHSPCGEPDCPVVCVSLKHSSVQVLTWGGVGSEDTERGPKFVVGNAWVEKRKLAMGDVEMGMKGSAKRTGGRIRYAVFVQYCVDAGMFMSEREPHVGKYQSARIRTSEPLPSIDLRPAL